uniref:hypothetical protein n=1 Tax=Desertihabitans aurantiacus TaxID=2282477 RepID=UPI0013004DCD
MDHGFVAGDGRRPHETTERALMTDTSPITPSRRSVLLGGGLAALAALGPLEALGARSAGA